jgi:hypothetical protein
MAEPRLSKIEQFPIDALDVSAMDSEHGWLTEAGMRHLIYSDAAENKPDCHIIDPSWFTQWEINRDASQLPVWLYEQTADATKAVNRIFIPYNLGNNHWTTIDINLESGRIKFYDSFTNTVNNLKAIDVMEQFCGDFGGSLNADAQKLHFRVMKCVQQGDGSSCGIYTCLNIGSLSTGKGVLRKVLSEQDIGTVRERGVRLLIEAQQKQGDEWYYLSLNH